MSNPSAGGPSLNPGPAKTYTVLRTVHHRFSIYVSNCHGDEHRKLVTRLGVTSNMKGLRQSIRRPHKIDLSFLVQKMSALA